MTSNATIAGLKDDVYSHSLSVTGRMDRYLDETDFPVECFPSIIQDIIIGLRESMGFPIDYTALAMLAAVSTAIGSSTRIRNFDNWMEPCILFSVIVGEPGTNKSHPLSAILKPLLDIDKAEYESYKAKYADYERRLQLQQGKKSEDDEDEDLQRPIRRQIIVDDVTIEALMQIMDENPRGVCLYNDEFSSFLDNMDRYTHGSSEQAYLSMFNGNPISKNRKGEKLSLRINDPFITITGTIQLGIITDLMEGRRKKNGFFERLVFAYPKKEIFPLWKDLRKKKSSDHYHLWERTIVSLYDESNRRIADGGRVLTLSEEACEVIDKWQQMNIERIRNEANSNIRVMYSKASIYILRFCLLLHELENSCLDTDKEVLNMHTVEKATKLAEYFANNSLRVIRHIYSNSLKEDELDVYNALPEEFRFGDGVKIAVDTIETWHEKKLRRFLDRHNGILFVNPSHGTYKKL